TQLAENCCTGKPLHKQVRLAQAEKLSFIIKNVAIRCSSSPDPERSKTALPFHLRSLVRQISKVFRMKDPSKLFGASCIRCPLRCSTTIGAVGNTNHNLV